MTKTGQLLMVVLAGGVLLWLGLAVYVLVSRLAHDARSSIVGRVRGLLEQGERDAGAGEQAQPARLLRRLPRRTVERVAADTATPLPVAAVFAKQALVDRRARIEGRARRTGARRRWRRVTALRILARGGGRRALALLEEALECGDEEVVSAAVSTLGEMQEEGAHAALVGALRRGVFSRSRIASQLDSASRPIGRQLMQLLRDPEPQVRFWGATLLARYAGDMTVDWELLAATGDADPSVRAAAVESLGGARSEAAAGGVVRLLADPVWFVRAHAARSLRRLGRADLAAAAAPLLADESWWVRTAAKEALEAHPGAAAAELAGYLGHDDEFARNGAAEVLQNTGALDALITRVTAAANPADLDLLARALAAGGEGMTAAAAERNGIDGGELERIASGAR